MVELFDPVVRQVDSFAGERVSMRVRQLDEGKNYNSHNLGHCNSHFFFLFPFCFFLGLWCVGDDRLIWSALMGAIQLVYSVTRDSLCKF